MKFSIIIPTSGRSSLLQKTLLSIARGSYPINNYEIIVVDNSYYLHERQNTREVVTSFEKIINISYIYSKKGGPSIARNLGIKKSKYTHLIFLDDDCFVPRDYINKYKESWAKYSNVKAIGGKVEPKTLFSFPNFIKDDYRWVFASQSFGDKEKFIKYPDFLFSANLSIKVNNLEKSKGIYNIRLGRRYIGTYCLFGEDTELNYRLQLQGKKIVYSPSVKVFNTIGRERLNRSYYFKRIFNAGIERRLIDDELKRKFASYTKYSPRLNVYAHIRHLVKSIFFYDKTQNPIFEELSYLFGYNIMGNLLIRLRIFIFL